ncbi:hypothetical protein [Embleya sp. NPDC005971]|uniref:hypothetical protein n=1 Tax=Embleya sp. NPDC005971 TaxID=3156724 RepID=UPI0033D61489
MEFEQGGLFEAQPFTRREADSLPYIGAPAEALTEDLAGDKYGWLLGLVSMPEALDCEQCHQPMTLGTVPLVWTCPRCHPRECAS